MKHLFALLAVLLPLHAQTPSPLRAGTFDRNAVTIAYYRSPTWEKAIKAKTLELSEAKRAGDTKRAAELETWGKDQQALAHKQLAGEAPLQPILDALSSEFAEVARRTKVAVIAGDLAFRAPGVETVDITDALMDVLGLDAQARKFIQDVRGKGPVKVHD